jgi:acyl carrier protein
MKTQEILQRLQLCLPRLAENLQEDVPLRALGLDSMDTVELLCVIHEEFGVRLTETEFQPHHQFADVLTVIAARAKPELTMA